MWTKENTFPSIDTPATDKGRLVDIQQKVYFDHYPSMFQPLTKHVL